MGFCVPQYVGPRHKQGDSKIKSFDTTSSSEDIQILKKDENPNYLNYTLRPFDKVNHFYPDQIIIITRCKGEKIKYFLFTTEIDHKSNSHNCNYEDEK